MSISAQIKALLSITGHKQAELLKLFRVSSKQSLSNKFSGERWSAEDLVKLADFTGCKLAFILPNGERLVVESSAPAVASTVNQSTPEHEPETE